MARGLHIEVTAFGDEQVARDLLRIGDRGVNLRPLWPLLAKYFYAMERAQFATEGAFSGHPWERLKDATIRRKRAKNQDKGILRATDTLYKSLTRQTARYASRTNSAGTFFRGSTHPVGVHHQHGAPRAGVPMRKPVDFRERDKLAWVKMIQRFVITGEMPTVPGL